MGLEFITEEEGRYRDLPLKTGGGVKEKIIVTNCRMKVVILVCLFIDGELMEMMVD